MDEPRELDKIKSFIKLDLTTIDQRFEEEMLARTNTVLQLLPAEIGSKGHAAQGLAIYALADLLNLLHNQKSQSRATLGLQTILNIVYDRSIQSRPWRSVGVWVLTTIKHRISLMESKRLDTTTWRPIPTPPTYCVRDPIPGSSERIVSDYIIHRATRDIRAHKWNLNVLDFCTHLARGPHGHLYMKDIGMRVASTLVLSWQIASESDSHLETLLAFMARLGPGASASEYVSASKEISAKLQIHKSRFHEGRRAMIQGVILLHRNRCRAPGPAENKLSLECDGWNDPAKWEVLWELLNTGTEVGTKVLATG